jgi:hypothetical protein
MAVARPRPAARYRAAVSSVGTSRHRTRARNARPAQETAGEPYAGSTVDFLLGNWNVVRKISDHRTGQVGSFRGQASLRPCEAGLGQQAGLADNPRPAALDGRVLAYHEHGELRFGEHLGPAGRRLQFRDLADGAADVRFADGREFYRLDLQSGTCQAAHPCRADRYLVTVTRLGADSYTETWRVVGPSKDYDLVATYTRVGFDAGPGWPQ